VNIQLADNIIGEIISKVPQQDPFRFIDGINYLDENRISGYYTFRKESSFYKGHFPGYPVTPGVILIEAMAQIGLVALGIFLLSRESEKRNALTEAVPLLARTEIDFRRQVLPGETVTVESEKILFRHKKLICHTTLLNSASEVVADGKITGFIFSRI
jgi:3-hydroxyacyl-[acyl-carrier-protein] dehydratase